MRSPIGSATSEIRCSSMKPVVLPMDQALLTLHRLALAVGGRHDRLPREKLGQRALVLVGKDPEEFTARRFPVIENGQRPGARGKAQMPLDQSAQQRLVADVAVAQSTIAGSGKVSLDLDLLRFRLNFFDTHHRCIAALLERAVLVVDEGNAPAHAGGEIAAGATEHDDGT